MRSFPGDIPFHLALFNDSESISMKLLSFHLLAFSRQDDFPTIFYVGTSI